MLLDRGLFINALPVPPSSAVDESEVRFCTQMKGKTSWFLPFNQDWNDGAGNPPNRDGLKTDHLREHILTRDGLTYTQGSAAAPGPR